MTSTPVDKHGIPIIDDSQFSELGKELIEAARQMIMFERGLLAEGDSGIVIHRFKQAADEVDVKNIRKKLKLTQKEFAIFINSSLRAVQHWEAKRRKPEGPTRMLLQLIDRNPKMVWNTMHYPNV